MKNFKDLQVFLTTASKEDRQEFFKNAAPLVQGLIQAVEGESSLLKETARTDLVAYLAFVAQFAHDQSLPILLFKDSELFTLLLKEQRHELIKQYNFIHQPTNLEIFQALSALGVIWEVTYDPRTQQTLMNDSLRPYSYLLSVQIDPENDEIKLLASVVDFVELELYLSGDQILARVKPQVEIQVAEQKQNWLDQISLIVSSINPEPAKYLGVALALGISLLSATDAQAGSKDAKDYLHKVDQALNKVEVPAGCQMGAKILATNAIGMTYEVQLGDYVVKTEFYKIGNVSERTEQTAYQLKDQKGCGLSKAEALEMATKVDKMVLKLWAGVN
jgi:hypothetical protein